MTPSSRWLADEMLGRLARYMRVLGMDTVYVRDMTDDQILRRLSEEGRTLITRDRALGARVAESLVLRSTDLPGQLRELFAYRPELSREPRFDRCTLCNGTLVAGAMPNPAPGIAPTTEVPRPGSADRFRCVACGHEYWEGSHTSRLRRDLQQWLGTAPT